MAFVDTRGMLDWLDEKRGRRFWTIVLAVALVAAIEIIALTTLDRSNAYALVRHGDLDLALMALAFVAGLACLYVGILVLFTFVIWVVLLLSGASASLGAVLRAGIAPAPIYVVTTPPILAACLAWLAFAPHETDAALNGYSLAIGVFNIYGLAVCIVALREAAELDSTLSAIAVLVFSGIISVGLVAVAIAFGPDAPPTFDGLPGPLVLWIETFVDETLEV